jgi:hypothetical protein
MSIFTWCFRERKENDEVEIVPGLVANFSAFMSYVCDSDGNVHSLIASANLYQTSCFIHSALLENRKVTVTGEHELICTAYLVFRYGIDYRIALQKVCDIIRASRGLAVTLNDSDMATLNSFSEKLFNVYDESTTSPRKLIRAIRAHDIPSIRQNSQFANAEYIDHPVYAAVCSRNNDVLKEVLRFRPNPDGTRVSPLGCAISYRNETAVRLLVEAKAVATSYDACQSVMQDNANIIACLVEARANFNGEELSALMYAIGLGRSTIVKMILPACRNINARSNYGGCEIEPLRVAITHDNTEIVEALLDAGATYVGVVTVQVNAGTEAVLKKHGIPIANDTTAVMKWECISANECEASGHPRREWKPGL